MSERFSHQSSEADLVCRAQAGDHHAFEQLIESDYPRAFAIARRITWNAEDAADVVQEASLRAFRAIDRFRGEARFSTWYVRIVYNTAFREARRQVHDRHAVEKITGLVHVHGEEFSDELLYPSSVEAEIESFVKPLRDALTLAAQDPALDAALAEHPRGKHLARLTRCLRDAVEGDLHDEARLLLALTDAGLLGADTTEDRSVPLRRLVWAAAHLREPGFYPVEQLNADLGGMKAVRRFMDDYIVPLIYPPESEAA